ncbi:cytochrome P450 [Streptomyces sp. NPDC051738]|uniref:cytochrome P450 n=1 Tax=Streptomyces sp. NPDC051738 TaxID=3365672 RepID=UPI0037D043F4
MSADSSPPPLRPMHRISLPEPGPPRLTSLATGTPVWLVTRYAEARQVLMDPRFDRSSLRAPDAPPLLVVPNLLDAPDGLRDPEVFPPGEPDLFAPLTSPTIAFGAGPHHCLGAWLARLELELALPRLAARFPNLRVEFTPGTNEWREGQMTRSPLRLPVSW